MTAQTPGLGGFLLRQFDIAWQLASYHLDGLTTDECLWRPAAVGLELRRQPDGTWRADWPDREGYDIGPPTIGWLTWHMTFWWRMALDHSFGDATLTREAIHWPGSAEGVRAVLDDCHERWRVRIAALTEDELRSTARTKWPFQDHPFGDVVAWASIELMKNAAEIGYARFLHGASKASKPGG